MSTGVTVSHNVKAEEGREDVMDEDDEEEDAEGMWMRIGLRMGPRRLWLKVRHCDNSSLLLELRVLQKITSPC